MREKEPKIRFKEFSEKWNDYRLSTVTEKYKELVPTPTDGYWRLGVRSHAKGTFLTYVPPGKQLGEKELSKVLSNNLMFNIVFAWEHAVAITNKDDEKALVSHRFPQFSFHDDMIPEFFKYLILDERFRQHLWLASPSGAGRNKTLVLDEAMDYKITIPKKEEQFEIVKFLEEIDKLISYHSEKCEKLIIMKENFLFLMFPQKGESIPRLRYRDYTKEWMPCKLGDILKYEQPQNYIVTNTEYDDKYDTPVLTAGQSFILGYTNEKSGIKSANKDNPVIIFDDFVTSSHFVDFPFKVKSSAIKLLTLNNNNDDFYFVFNVLKNIGYVPKSHERHWISIFANMNVMMPTDYMEQKDIGDFFANTEELINSQHKKVQMLQNIKSACLNNMLI